jgi:ubiquinone/menaquinone biosynthesis C-methylase UbiE
MEITSTDYYNETARTYDDAYNTLYWKFYHELSWSYIQKYLPADKQNCRILDAGGGTGFWSIKIAQLGYNVVLTDISSSMLDVAQEKIGREKLEANIQIVKADIVTMPEFENEIFDLVVAEGDAISYCSYPYLAIGELSRITRKDGHVIVSVDNKYTWAKRAVEKADFEEAERILATGIVRMPVENGDYFTSYAYTTDELEKIFGTNGLRTVFQIGKPVFTVPQFLHADNYDYLLDFEMRYSTTPQAANFGGHIAVIGRKV